MFLFSIKQKCIFILLLIASGTVAQAQPVKRVQPVWWFGESVAGNLNNYQGTTQMLNDYFSVPTAFHKGQAVKPYASLLTEYRPNKRWGGMLNIAYDNRGVKFDQVLAPCNCAADLSTDLSYLTIEPSVRFAPFASGFYVFAGPTLGINLTKSFSYTQEKQTGTQGDRTDINKAVFSAQAGAGIDIPVSSRKAMIQMTLSPFASFQTNLLQDPGTTGSWSFYTVRAGMAVKFGKGKPFLLPAPLPSPAAAATGITARVTVPTPAPIIIVQKEVQFSVHAPKISIANRNATARETFPLLTSLFFEAGSTVIPQRYSLLTKEQALFFTEEQLQQQRDALNTSRASRQMTAYHHILNIMGSRMRLYPQTTISLHTVGTDASESGVMAENIRQYMVNIFGIDAARIQVDATADQTMRSANSSLRREEERRIDIVSNSRELLAQVGELKIAPTSTTQPVAEDRQVIFTLDNAAELLTSWSLEITDEQGIQQHYGPFTQNQASIADNTILRNNNISNYTVKMIGQSKSGGTITKEASVSLAKTEQPKTPTSLYSVLFGFDRSDLTPTYQEFLTQTIGTAIPAKATVVIFGYTDITGADAHNLHLSRARVNTVQQLLQQALSGKEIIFKTHGFGKDSNMTPFANELPEERFYNRTIMISVNGGL